MTKTTLIDALTVAFVVVCGAVGTIEAARRDESGLAVLFVVTVAASIAPAISRLRQRRQPVLVRADLHRWLAVTSAVTGEAVSDLADRCISSYRAGLQE